MAASVYVHLPFCPYICPYCDFAKWPVRRSQAERYLRALYAEIDSTPRHAAATLFFGGGTPNTYAAADIAALNLRLRERFSMPDGAEISIEANPELLDGDALRVYRDCGITRLSLGVQSFVRSEIATLGRRHSPEVVYRAVSAARDAGFSDVSIDLIFGVPAQTLESWDESLARAIDLNVDHVSCYGLTVEENTPYAAWREREPDAFPGQDLEADLYACAVDRLRAAGFEQYEISNFARPGHRCRHNENYWSNGEYAGLGVGAASYLGGTRSVHTRDLDTYLQAVEAGRPIPSESETLEGGARTGEAIMLALRTAEGVDVAGFQRRYGVDVAQAYAATVKEYAGAGLLEYRDGYLRLTDRGRPVANDVCGAFLSFE